MKAYTLNELTPEVLTGSQEVYITIGDQKTKYWQSICKVLRREKETDEDFSWTVFMYALFTHAREKGPVMIDVLYD